MSLKCDVCGDDAIAVKPGDDGEEAIIGGVRVILRTGRPDRAWCFEHWPCAPRQRALFAEDRL